MPHPSSPDPRVLLVTAAIAHAGMPHVPVLRELWWPLARVGTLAHELGHGVAAMLVGRRFTSFEIRWDGSGVAHSAGAAEGLGRAFTAAGGLLGPAVVAVVCFLLARTVSGARAGLIAIGLGLGATLLLANSVFTVGFVAAVAAVCLFFGWWGRESARGALAFVGVNLATQVFSRSDYLFAATTSRGQLSDVGQIAAQLGGPYWLWGGLVGAVCVGVLALGLWVAWRR